MQTIIFTVLITAGLCFAGLVTYGQTFSEWWQQKKTRIKYLRQQEAALEALKESMENGYEAAEEGVDSITTITEEELSIHEQFVKSLKFVKPALKNSPEYLFCRALASALTKQAVETIRNYFQHPELTGYHLRWLRVIITPMFEGLRNDLDELDLLTSDGIVTMKDNERYEKIHAIASNIRATYDAGISFLLQLDDMLILKQEEANDEFIRRRL